MSTDEPTPPLVRVEVADGVRTLTLDSPHNRNALSRRLVAELHDGLRRAEGDPDTRVVVLAADGPAFCAGADLKEASEPGGGENAGHALLALLRTMLALPQPVLARVHAPVRAGGIGLVAAADLAIGAHEATFAFTEARLGLTPAIISLPVLERMPSRSAARALLTGRTLTGRQAADAGLLTEAVADDDLDAALDEELDALLRGSPQGLAETKRLLTAPLLARLEADGPAMVALSERLFASEEAALGMRAFLAREDPPWAAAQRRTGA
jgi:enoyl-CoA hydratase